MRVYTLVLILALKQPPPRMVLLFSDLREGQTNPPRTQLFIWRQTHFYTNLRNKSSSLGTYNIHLCTHTWSNILLNHRNSMKKFSNDFNSCLLRLRGHCCARVGRASVKHWIALDFHKLFSYMCTKLRLGLQVILEPWLAIQNCNLHEPWSVFMAAKETVSNKNRRISRSYNHLSTTYSRGFSAKIAQTTLFQIGKFLFSTFRPKKSTLLLFFLSLLNEHVLQQDLFG